MENFIFSAVCVRSLEINLMNSEVEFDTLRSVFGK